VGGYVQSAGINSHVFPKEYARIEALPLSERPAAVANFYRTNFWGKWLAQITLDDVAKRVFDAGVNMGTGTAVELVQRAVGVLDDGDWGPQTLSAVNYAGALLVPEFKNVRCQHYRDIVAHDPTKAKYLKGWLARAAK